MELPALACVNTGNEGTETMDERGSRTVSVGTNVRSLLKVVGSCPKVSYSVVVPVVTVK